MKKLYYYLVIIVILNTNSELICQIVISSQYLKKLYDNLPSDCKLIITENLALNKYSITTKNIIPNYEIEIDYYITGGKVEDFGIPIVNPFVRNLILSEDICRFIERKTLELLLMPNDKSLIEKLHENNIKILLNNNSVISRAMMQEVYSIMYSNGNLKLKREGANYELSWNSVSNESVIFTFPATNTLIRGMDKKELDEEIIEHLEEIHYSIEKIDKEKLSTNNISRSDLIKKDSIYCLKKDSFVIKEINNNLYFKVQNGVLQYVYEPSYIDESLCNLIQLPQLNDNLKANINHNIYGNERVNYTMNFQELVTYFKNSCSLYTGIEKKTEKGIKAIIIMLNDKLNVLHMMVIDVDKDILFNKDGSIAIELRTNIPTNNIDNLFGEYIPQKTQYKVLIK